jgi:hypothetical protein
MSERVRRTVLLLETLDDYLPTPRTASGAIAAQGPSTVTPSNCATCSGEGCTRYGSCHACNGSGQHAPAMETWQLDAEIARLESNERARRGKLPGGLEAWERERKRYEKAGDYVALRRALQLLGRYAPTRVRLVTAIHILQLPVIASDVVRRELADTLHCLSELMPSPIRVPEWVDSKAGHDQTLKLARGRSADVRVLARRDAQIREEYAGGARQADIAASWALSQGQVSRIVTSVATAA